jgi:hypothetical protein
MTRALDWLSPTSAGPFTGQARGSAEAESLRFDGLAAEIWPGVLRALDLAAGPEGRTGAVAELVPRGAVLAYRSAVWVHTGRYRPDRLDVVLSGGRQRSCAAVRMHTERLASADVLVLGAMAVTSPARTAVDVARRSHPRDVQEWLAALRAHGLCPAEVEDALSRAGRLRGTPRARALLAPDLRRRARSSD